MKVQNIYAYSFNRNKKKINKKFIKIIVRNLYTLTH